MINLKVIDNAVFRLSGNSAFSGIDSGGNIISAEVEIENAEVQSLM